MKSLIQTAAKLTIEALAIAFVAGVLAMLVS